MPAWPVAPATKTVVGSLRLVFPNDKPPPPPAEDGLVRTGIKDLTSGTLPKSKRKGLELVLSSGSADSPEASPPPFPSPNENGSDLLAKTLNLRVLLPVKVDELGVEVRRIEWEVGVAAMEEEEEEEEEGVGGAERPISLFVNS